MIGQNGYFGGMRRVRFSTNCFFMGRLLRFDEVTAKCLPFVPKVLNQSLQF